MATPFSSERNVQRKRKREREGKSAFEKYELISKNWCSIRHECVNRRSTYLEIVIL
jgi:hypothetical protein